MQFYEERRVMLKRGALGAYRKLVLETTWPALIEAGARPLCLLSGLIGAPVQETYLFVGFPDAVSWQQGQGLITGLSVEEGRAAGPIRARAALLEEESARLLIPSPFRPSAEPRREERRAVYGFRKWWIKPETFPEFEHCTHEGVWPAMDAMGHWVLGHFREAFTSELLEVSNLAGYYDPAHWQRTRTAAAPENNVPAELLAKLAELAPRRNALTLKSYVKLMTAHWPD